MARRMRRSAPRALVGGPETEASPGPLANQRRWLQSLLDLSPVPLILLDPTNEEVVFANRAADELAGGRFPRGRPEHRPPPFDRVTRPDGTPLLSEELPAIRALRGERLDRFQFDWHLPHGRRSLVAFSERLPAMFGHPETIVVSYVDITQQREVETALHRAVAARDEFLSVAAHELRTPLTSLRLYIQRLARLTRNRDHDLPGELRERVENADRQVARLSRLVENLLDVSRINSGRLELEIEDVDLAELVRETLTRMAEDAERGRCPVDLQAPGPAIGRWDRLRLEQVVENLLSNAFKYGAGAPVKIAVADQGGDVMLEVRDHGIGIAPEDHERLFRRFERAVSERHYGGFGLGLWIVRQIVAALGGTVAVDSKPGAGARFTVVLPKAAHARA
jgi:signal transduction histidine kinase